MAKRITIKQFVRKISMHNMKADPDLDLIQEVDRELSDYYNSGFILKFITPLGKTENAWIIHYTLEKAIEKAIEKAK